MLNRFLGVSALAAALSVAWFSTIKIVWNSPAVTVSVDGQSTNSSRLSVTLREPTQKSQAAKFTEGHLGPDGMGDGTLSDVGF
jgi:hypothetical protein